MDAAYPGRLSVILSERYGGAPENWEGAHRTSHAWYIGHMASAEAWSGRPWIETVNAADAEYVLRLFQAAGVPAPEDPLVTSRSLETEVMSSIDAAYPDAKPAIARLKAAGHRLVVATNATESNARGSLLGARLLDAFETVFTGELLEGGKEQGEYWRKASERVQGGVRPGLAVDDRPEYLRAATSVGIVGLLMDRQGASSAAALPRGVRATLRNLAGLPHFVDLLEWERAHTST